MIATVLAAKNGVITEERFQKMTEAQWLFTYLEIKKNQEKKSREEIERLILLIKNIRVAGCSSHKDVNLKHAMDMIENIRSPWEKSAEMEAQEAIDYVKENANIFPEVITVSKREDAVNNTPKGRIDKELGIVIPE